MKDSLIELFPPLKSNLGTDAEWFLQQIPWHSEWGACKDGDESHQWIQARPYNVKQQWEEGLRNLKATDGNQQHNKRRDLAGTAFMDLADEIKSALLHVFADAIMQCTGERNKEKIMNEMNSGNHLVVAVGIGKIDRQRVLCVAISGCHTTHEGKIFAEEMQFSHYRPLIDKLLATCVKQAVMRSKCVARLKELGINLDAFGKLYITSAKPGYPRVHAECILVIQYCHVIFVKARICSRCMSLMCCLSAHGHAIYLFVKGAQGKVIRPPFRSGDGERTETTFDDVISWSDGYRSHDCCAACRRNYYSCQHFEVKQETREISWRNRLCLTTVCDFERSREEPG